MTGSDQKFWIGIASAFILPTLAYVYTQGMTAQSIDSLAKSVDKFQTSVDAANTRLANVERDNSNNTLAIVQANKHLDQIDQVLEKHGERLIIIETKTRVR